MKILSEKENQSLQKYKKIDPNIKSKVCRWKRFRKVFWSYLKVENDCFEGSNVIFFTFFVKFQGTNLKPFSGEANQTLHGFILKFARGSIFEIRFEATLNSKTNVLTVWKWMFKFFCTFFSGQVESVLGEIKAKHTKLCKFEEGHRKHFRKWFWN